MCVCVKAFVCKSVTVCKSITVCNSVCEKVSACARVCVSKLCVKDASVYQTLLSPLHFPGHPFSSSHLNSLPSHLHICTYHLYILTASFSHRRIPSSHVHIFSLSPSLSVSDLPLPHLPILTLPVMMKVIHTLVTMLLFALGPSVIWWLQCLHC